jgi:hypothetical protein
MYTAGQGTVANHTLTAIYIRRADERKHDMERRQELNERAANRQAQVLSSFVLGALFGMFLEPIRYRASGRYIHICEYLLQAERTN